MSSRLAARARRYIGRSPLLQIALFVVVLVVVLLVAEYSDIFGA
jgi:hypothetical protein